MCHCIALHTDHQSPAHAFHRLLGGLEVEDIKFAGAELLQGIAVDERFAESELCMQPHSNKTAGTASSDC